MVFCMLCLNPLSASAKSKNNVEKIGNSWFYTKNEHISSNYTGFGDNQYGTWYCRNGKVDFGANGVLYGTYQNRTVWGYVVNGKLQQYETVAKNSNGWWYISPNGFVDFSADTVAKNSNGWWGIQNGKVNFNYTSLADNKNGTWYCRNRKLDYSATTVADEKNN